MYQVADTALLPDRIPQMHAAVAMVTDDNAVLAQRADASQRWTFLISSPRAAAILWIPDLPVTICP